MSAHPDDGIATVWAAAGVAAIMAALLVGLHVGGAIAARHRAESAADLAALAAAALAVQGQPVACRRAAEIAGAVGGEIRHCLLSGWEAVVEVRFPVPMALPGADAAFGRARAGPVEPDQAPWGVTRSTVVLPRPTVDGPVRSRADRDAWPARRLGAALPRSSWQSNRWATATGNEADTGPYWSWSCSASAGQPRARSPDRGGAGASQTPP